ncbi:MAG: MMPL family transporter [Ilumatobacteraceae bacterium]
MLFGIWIPILIVINVVGGAAGTNYHTDFNQPDSESKSVQDALKAAGNQADAGFPAQIVFTAPQGTSDPAVKAAIEPFLAQVATLDGVSVISPYSPEGTGFNSDTQPISFAQMSYTERSQSKAKDLADEIQGLGDKIDVPGLDIEYGGDLFAKFELPSSEVLGILAAVVILLIAFGSVLAMGLPIGSALFGLGVGMALIGVASHLTSMPDFAPQMAAMIGLGVGIDYALFIVSRYRENLHAGMEPEQATVDALDSSGRAVIFAGITVVIALLGLMIMGLGFVNGLAIGAALGVLVMMLASITLLPALLGFVGKRIDTTSRAAAAAVGAFVVLALAGVIIDKLGPMFGLGLLVAAIIVGVSFLPFGRSLRTPLPHRHEKPREERFWFKWSRFVQHRPWPSLLVGVLVLVVLAIPLLSIRLGFSDNGNAPEGQTVRKAYDLVADGFGPGTNGPLFLTTTDPNANADTVAKVDAVLAADTGIAQAGKGTQLGESGTWLWRVYPTSAPQDEATTNLVNRLRNTELPTTGIKVDVGGFTAGGIDFASYIGGRLPILIGAVLLLSFLLLMVVFRSILVPLKAVVLNLLSVGAAYGVVVAIFQWGWGKDLFGVGKAGPVEAWAPMMLFAITFGLSMDYEVFLLSRMKEEYDRTGNNTTAVADGLAVTARVITAAALIMVCVFSAFVLGDQRALKLFGLGLAVAVLVDATVVRMVLVPATMELLGERNWWIPKWLNRILPRIDVEGHHDISGLAAPEERESELV